MNKQKRLAMIRRSAENLGLVREVPVPVDVVDSLNEGDRDREVELEVEGWRAEATNAGFRDASSPLAGVLGQRGRR